MFKRALTLSAAGMSVGFGTCGVGMLTGGSSSVFGYLAAGGTTLFAVSLLAMIVTLLVGSVVWIVRYFNQ